MAMGTSSGLTQGPGTKEEAAPVSPGDSLVGLSLSSPPLLTLVSAYHTELIC